MGDQGAKGEARIRLLVPDDDRSRFACGDIELDRFFQRFAGLNQFRHHIGSTYVAVLDGEVIGFATVSPSELTADAVSGLTKKKLPAYPIPVLRIARLAVDGRFQGRRIGGFLLRAMFELALELRDKAGCAGVVVDAKPGAIVFYQKLGFMPLTVERGALGDRPEPLPMFLPIRLVEKAKEDGGRGGN